METETARLPSFRWVLLRVEWPYCGWRRDPPPEQPRLQLQSLSGPPWTLYLEAHDELGSLSVEPVGPVPEPIVFAALEDLRVVRELWLDDCITEWGWLSAEAVDGRAVLRVYGGTERERVLDLRFPLLPLRGELVVHEARLLPDPPRLLAETSLGPQLVPLADVVFPAPAAGDPRRKAR